MTGVVVLTSEEARRRARASERHSEVAWCSCPIWQRCRCGNEAPVMPSASAAGWAVAR